MDKLTVKIAFSKDNFREGLDYYIDKGGVVRKFTRDGIDCSGSIDTEFYVDNNIQKETLRLRIEREYNRLLNSPLGDDKNSDMSYAYVYSEYGELIRIYEINDNDEELTIKGYDARDFYREEGLSYEEIEEGERVLSIIAIRDGMNELREAIMHSEISAAAMILSAILLIFNSELFKGIGVLTGSTSSVTSILSINEIRRIREKIIHHVKLLQSGLETDETKLESMIEDCKSMLKKNYKG